eukprot:6181351-Pleurochrysis_carterae.AAC.2
MSGDPATLCVSAEMLYAADSSPEKAAAKSADMYGWSARIICTPVAWRLRRRQLHRNRKLCLRLLLRHSPRPALVPY